MHYASIKVLATEVFIFLLALIPYYFNLRFLPVILLFTSYLTQIGRYLGMCASRF